MIGAEVVAACRLVVAGALAVAAAGKFADRRSTVERTVALLGGVGRPVAALLPIVEVGLAVALLAWWAPWPGIAAAALLAAFTAVLGHAYRRRLPCPCFGGAAIGRPPGTREFVRNGLLVVAALFAIGSPAGARVIGAAAATVTLGVLVAAVARPPR